MKFEWDEVKNQENIAKHGVSFDLAKEAFADVGKKIFPDHLHSDEEERYFCFGCVTGRILTVRFTVRGSKIRIFGAGFWRKGEIIYDKQT
jgi:uncharacterized DUF497 family protein